MRFYLAGQNNFGNRGCEALVRSITGMLRSRFGDAAILVPSFDFARDARQWPMAPEFGCEFVQPFEVPPLLKWWNRAIRVLPATRGLWEPRFQPSGTTAVDLRRSDAVLMIGGDVISLDYGPGSLFQWSGLMDAAHRMGKPTMLFAASVGPFNDPIIERFMVAHLARYSAITVRESKSLAYLDHLGVRYAKLVADPAFRLDPESAPELPELGGGDAEGVLGFNLSPLIEAGWKRANGGDLVVEATAFLRRVMEETSLAIDLIPHVDPLNGISENSDSDYMARVMHALGGPSERLRLIPRGLNAAQIKSVISRCRFFIGARTHATVAAWSTAVPTISIAYSVKAKGLNKDLFDTLDYVLETPQVSRESLWRAYLLLVEREVPLRALLAERIPLWRERALGSMDVLERAIQ